MLRRLSGRVNEGLSRLFPEKRLILRSETSTRYMRISPLAQTGGAALAIALVGWTTFTTLTVADTSFRAASAEARLAVIGDAYEARIAALTDQTITLADDLSEARSRAAVALGELSNQHATLSNAVATERELATALQSHRHRLDTLSGEHDETVKVCEATANQVTALEVKLLGYERENTALSDALAALNHALDDVATERDVASESSLALTLQLDELSAEISERSERRSRVLSQLEDAAALSLGSLESVFEKSGVKIEPILSAVRKEYDGEGGPFVPVGELDEMTAKSEDAERLSLLMQDLERVNALRIAAERLPFARPARAARFTSGFGGRRDPKNGRRARHSGIDLAGPRGTPIYATAVGTVVKAGWSRGYGKLIKIQHAFGYETVYAHLHQIRVKVGDVVERGDRIGDMGSTGRSTGTHLHYEVRIGGTPVNPAKYIEAARHVL